MARAGVMHRFTQGIVKGIVVSGLAFALVGCGGGSSSTSGTSSTSPPSQPPVGLVSVVPNSSSATQPPSKLSASFAVNVTSVGPTFVQVTGTCSTLPTVTTSISAGVVTVALAGGNCLPGQTLTLTVDPSQVILASPVQQVGAVWTQTYTVPLTKQNVGGTITGLVGTAVLANNGTDLLTLTADGSFVFPTQVQQNSPYAVTVRSQPANQTCSVSSGTGTVGGSAVKSVQVNCSNNAMTVGGTVTGLTGTVVLQNNGGDNLTLIAEGPYTFATPVANGSLYAVTVLTQPSGQVCIAQNASGTMGGANITNVNLTCAAPTSLSVTAPATAVIPVGTGTPGTLTVNNTGNQPALNVRVALPSNWTGVTQDASGCTNVAVGGHCTISLTSTSPYIAQGGISVTGDNVNSPGTAALATSIGGFQVFSIDSPSTATVIDSTDSASVVWGTGGLATNAQSLTDGAANTNTIVNADPGGAAAAACANDTSGGSLPGTWYLPAICQIDGSSSLAGCAAGTANIRDNLTAFGFGGLDTHRAIYWSSTENSTSPTSAAWGYRPLGRRAQSALKGVSAPARCVRSINY